MKPRLICICGATATGKTDVAFELAQKLETEIISFDSLQVYKYLDIGTAKPSIEMRMAVKHHLVDAVEPTENFTAGDFKKQAEAVITQLSKSGKPVVLVGGTGFYLQALLKGMYDIPPVSPEIKNAVEAELQSRGNEVMYQELCGLDPEYAKKIHPNDSYRIARAFEVLRSGDKTVTEIKRDFAQKPPPYTVHLVGLRRVKGRLKEQIEKRTERMLSQGLVDETRGLLAKYPQGLKPLDSVGYKETCSYLEGKIEEKSLRAAIVKSTVLLAKRQTTWFKRDPAIHWFDPDEGPVLENILRLTIS